MYELSVDSHFAAAHCLRDYKGDCARLHGHTWKVTVIIEAGTINEIGICIDFKDVARALDEIVGRFDHQTLNNLDEFREMNPTAENLGKLIFNLLSEKLESDNVRVLSVTVAESDRYRVTYRKNESR